jgi:hypothetical protein
MVPEQIGRTAARIPGDIDMTDIALTPDVRPVPIPVGELLPWAIYAGRFIS